MDLTMQAREWVNVSYLLSGITPEVKYMRIDRSGRSLKNQRQERVSICHYLAKSSVWFAIDRPAVRLGAIGCLAV